ncbi:hypothetical protein CFSAN000560_19450 [Salmonella enterica subsp. arizonae str. CFSAN000560]|uniref:Uncharacterized protein n=2 Tax=Salmonella enterica TaxID=28901 RepID=A0A7T8J8X7_SALET|nr:hypothetical protein N898_12960 [Salmonella enterica subsp. arizonae serovar 62:z36:- str. RKS2983]EAM8643388.1 hypothetical protein [Salmonella enterica]EAO6001640.1 hypothetical protein [Salmonella enterica subsp. arizonae serovar 62:z36:-]ECG1413859.1 hypothetical protein [Salmonella enterica subsp. arizonae str. CFSAN000560]KSB75821.1 hypothetical protein LFZ49_01080 [Salmonella enterica subsp. arizonae serovar 62:z36:- str. 5335/86]QQP07181.1 hypothetical protein JG555_17125 [Salmonell
MTLLIGDKSRIAVEYSIDNREKLIGRAKIWLNHVFIGSLSDTIFIDGYLIGGFNEILSKMVLNDRYLSDNPIKIYESINNDMLCDDDILYDLAKSYRVNFGTWSDYFNVYSYKLSKNTGVILWQLTERNDELKDLINYPSCVFYETFNYSDLFEIIDHLNSIKTQH